MHRFFACLVFAVSVSAVAQGKTTVYVNEASYSIDGVKRSLDKRSLTEQLKKNSINEVILAVDVCAGPMQVANAYIALDEANVQEVELKGVGELKAGGCRNV